ncbi:hypothetical protein IV203_015416 [Nitzschia inconspicua]|uniref:HTTM-like domain-containing protein n=1 Tax=Nitzschia inconspicua TaxID=303405 RepID=A0A9K3PT89_9STRA|nr:hypothetical protein IV203_015416 [Nitzschia inconspicua]
MEKRTTPAKNASSTVGGWRPVLGCSVKAMALFRITLGCLLTAELILRFRFLRVFYSDEGTMPLRLLLPRIDGLYQKICLHCHFGELWQQQLLLGIQTVAAIMFTLGYHTRFMAILSWYLYTSLILRNTWLYFILDRYFYYLLFYAMFLPLDQYWSFSKHERKSEYDNLPKGVFVNPATMALKLLVFWIYIDAGVGKYLDPKQGWTYHADPLPALDTYCRHTLCAQYLYAILGPKGLRFLTPTVVWIEILSTPLALLGSYLGNASMVNFAILFICHLHLGISATIRNSVLLSFVACSAWCIFLPIGWGENAPTGDAFPPRSFWPKLSSTATIILVCAMVGGNIWFETIGTDCSNGSLRGIWSTLLQNRWNVFIGAEEYVTWEIAPGRLRDGSVVDVWGRSDEVNWMMPGSGAPCTSTSRPGRWRSFPYLADLEGEEAEALWGYLCKQWDRENNVKSNPGRQLLRYNFFMLQADVLPNMAFSPTRKRLVHSYECVIDASAAQYENEVDAKADVTIADDPSKSEL